MFFITVVCALLVAVSRPRMVTRLLLLVKGDVRASHDQICGPLRLKSITMCLKTVERRGAAYIGLAGT